MNVTNPWEMTVGKGGTGGGGGEYVLCPANNWTGIIVGMFFVGHENEKNDKGQYVDRPKFVIAFELTKKKPDGSRFVLSQKYTFSMKDNSNFYALASNVTGKQYNDGDPFDPRSLLGMPCTVSVTHNKGKKDPTKTYHNVGAVTQWGSEDDDGNPKPRPEPVISPIAWSIYDGKPLPDVQWVPYVYGESIASLVERSSEWKAGKLHPSILGRADAPEPVANDVPF